MKYSEKNNLKELRQNRGLTMQELAKISGVAYATIVALEEDKNDFYEIKLSTLTKLCNSLHATPTQLLKDEKVVGELRHYCRPKYAVLKAKKK